MHSAVAKSDILFLRTHEQVMGDLHLQMNSDFGGFLTRIKGS